MLRTCASEVSRCLKNIPSRSAAPAVWLVLALAAWAPSACGLPPETDSASSAATIEPAAFSTWVRSARIGGATVRKGMTPSEMNQLMSTLVAQNVSVVEADFEEGLSKYRTEAEFEQFLEPMRKLAVAAHDRGLKIVLYYASLEVLTPNGVNLARTMAKDHPSWVQVGLDGKPNVAYGGSATTPWVEPGMEDAWMSPSSPYRDLYIGRAAKIAATGMDGLWVDVPLYTAWGSSLWNDVSTFAASKFRSATGYTAPRREDWSDPAWRRWIAWRHQELRDFIADVAKATRPQAQSEFVVLVETLPTDYTGSTIWGLEGADLRSIPGVTCVWEVSTLSVNTAMRRAREDDWISYIAMQKYIRAAVGTKPSWSFAYAKNPDDAQLVAGEVLAARNNVYELKQPEMSSTVGAAYRTSLFGWIEANEGALFESTPGARVAILYSPASRDYVDRFSALGQYVTTNTSDPLWWESSPTGSASTLQYVAEYRGLVKLLVHSHIPFEVVVKPGSAAELSRYQVVLAPDPEALSSAEAQLLQDYVSSGGRLIVTGPNPGGWDEYGASRSEYALSQVLGVRKGSTLPSSKVQPYGSGEGRFFSALLGKRYYTNTSDAAAAASTLLAAVRATSTPWLSTSANKKVHIELSLGTNKLFLQYVNSIGVTGSLSVAPTTAATTLKIPAGKEVTAVGWTSPEGAGPSLTSLSFTRSGQDVSFTVPVSMYTLVVVSLRSTGTNPNQPPATYSAQAVTVLTGTVDHGSATSLKAQDTDTYDIRSSYVAGDGGGVTDWYGKTTVSGAPSGIGQITVTYAGQFSKTGVVQRLYLYNFKQGAWDLLDTRTVGNTVDVTVTVNVTTKASDYVASAPMGELRVRVKGVRAGAATSSTTSFYSWANSLSWEVR